MDNLDELDAVKREEELVAAKRREDELQQKAAEFNEASAESATRERPRLFSTVEEFIRKAKEGKLFVRDEPFQAGPLLARDVKDGKRPTTEEPHKIYLTDINNNPEAAAALTNEELITAKRLQIAQLEDEIAKLQNSVLVPSPSLNPPSIFQGG